MNFYLQIIVIPLISTFIGYLTNWIAIWMLFNPKNEKQILGLKIQGVFPKNQIKIAKNIGLVVSENLLSKDEIKNKLFDEENISDIKNIIKIKLEKYLNEELKSKYPIISMFVGNNTKSTIELEILNKIEEIINEFKTNFDNYYENKINIQKIVEDKIIQLDSMQISHLMQNMMKTELKFIEILGAILGFIIGIIQVIILYILK